MRSVLVVLLAALAVPAAAASPSRLPARLDLAAGTINGRPILGEPMHRVTAGFGRPTDHDPGLGGRRWVTYGDFPFLLRVVFSRDRAWSMTVHNPAVTEVRLGRLLAMAPEQIEAAISREYGNLFELVKPYSCGGFFCDGMFKAVAGSRRITFGLVRGHAFVTLYEIRYP
jgi:hypothetical protein